MSLAGLVAGALWGLLPTLLKVQLGVNGVITTLMMNYIALHLVQWLIHGPWKGKSSLAFAYTDAFPPAAWLPLFVGTRLHWPTALMGLVLTVLLWFVLFCTRWGIIMRSVGEAPAAADALGIRIVLVRYLCVGFGGVLAGVGGGCLSVSYLPAWTEGITAGMGWIALALAIFAAWNPLWAMGGQWSLTA